MKAEPGTAPPEPGCWEHASGGAAQPEESPQGGAGELSSWPTTTSPLFWPYFPNRPVPIPPVPVVRLNILAWREGRREPRGPSEPIHLDWGRGEDRSAPPPPGVRSGRRPSGTREQSAPLQIPKDSPARSARGHSLLSVARQAPRASLALAAGWPLLLCTLCHFLPLGAPLSLSLCCLHACPLLSLPSR